MPIDWNKPLQTNEGEQARLLGVLNGDTYIVAVTDNETDYEHAYEYNKLGECLYEDDEGRFDIFNLVNTPQKLTRWLNIYPDGRYVHFHETRQEADESANNKRIACIKVEFEEGEGL